MTAPAHPHAAHAGLRFTAIIAALSMLAPFSIDTYLPSFPDMARDFAVAPWALQQTLSVYLSSFAAMTLVYGPLSDAFGRRRVVLAGLALYAASSVGAALAANLGMMLAMRVGQGLAAGAGVVIGRAIIRDVFAGAQAQRVMSQVYLIFAVAPALAPVLGGWLHDALGWRSVFWFLAVLGAGVWLAVWFGLPETLPPVGRQSAHPRAIAAGYARAFASTRFMLLVVTLGFNFAAFFVYVASSPDVIYRHLGRAAEDFGVLFIPAVAGLMTGSWLSGRTAGRLSAVQTAMTGYGVMLLATGANLALAALTAPTPLTVVGPLALYTVGMAFAMPSLNLLALDVFPTHRGLASAVLGFVHTLMSALVAGVVSPLLSGRLVMLALGMLLLNLVGLAFWLVWRARHGVEDALTAAPS
jgi:DHA1 family bicyclomycin/chloramphenicol resistance-like MFS transporter